MNKRTGTSVGTRTIAVVKYVRAFVATMALTTLGLHAASGTWTLNASGNWSTPGNWSGSTVADGTDATATFGDFINATRTVTNDTVRTIGHLSALDTSNNYVLSGTNVLTLDVTSGLSSINVSTAGRTLTIGTPVTVNDGIQKNGAGNLTFSGPVTGNGVIQMNGVGNLAFGGPVTVNGVIQMNGAGNLAFSGPITLGAAQTWTNGSAGTFTTANGVNMINNNGFPLTIDGTGSVTFGTLNSTNVTLSGTGALVKNGTSKLSMGGKNNTIFSGNVTINGGVLQYGDFPDSLGSGNVTIANGILEARWSTGLSRTQGTGPGQIQVTGGESGFSLEANTTLTTGIGPITWGSVTFNPVKFVLQSQFSSANSLINFNSDIDLNGSTRTILVNGGTTGAAKAQLAGLINNSTGTAGLTKEGAGALAITNALSAWNGTTTISAGCFDMSAGGMPLANMGGGSGRNIIIGSGASLRFDGKLSNTILNRLDENANEMFLLTEGEGSTTPNPNNLDFSSSTGANVPNAFFGGYHSTGNPSVYSGILTPASDNYRLGASSFGNGCFVMNNSATMTGTQGLIVSGNVLLIGAKTFTGDTVIRAGAKLGLSAYTGSNEALSLQNSVLDTTASAGTLWLEQGGSGQPTGVSLTRSATFGGLKGNKNLSAVVTASSGGNNVYAMPVTGITGFTLNPGTGVTCTYSGVIANFTNGTTITKSGAGTQILANTNVYTGATIVNEGTLALGVNNALPSSSPLVMGNGTLDMVTYTNVVGTLEVTGSTGVINLGTGAKLFFPDSSAVAWSGTKLIISGNFVPGESIRFGTNANALTTEQLSKISLSTGGSAGLDANGYLKFFSGTLIQFY